MPDGVFAVPPEPLLLFFAGHDRRVAEVSEPPVRSREAKAASHMTLVAFRTSYGTARPQVLARYAKRFATLAGSENSDHAETEDGSLYGRRSVVCCRPESTGPQERSRKAKQKNRQARARRERTRTTNRLPDWRVHSAIRCVDFSTAAALNTLRCRNTLRAHGRVQVQVPVPLKLGATPAQRRPDRDHRRHWPRGRRTVRKFRSAVHAAIDSRSDGRRSIDVRRRNVICFPTISWRAAAGRLGVVGCSSLHPPCIHEPLKGR